MSYIYIFFFASLFLLGISLGFNLNFKQFNNAIHTYKRKGSAINGSKVRRKMEIDKRVVYPYLENSMGITVINEHVDIIVTTR